MPTSSSANEDSEKVAEAGECFARGLALLVGTQFGGEVVWKPDPIHAAHDRWRVEFSWAAVSDGRNPIHGDDDDNDENDNDDHNEERRNDDD